MSTRRTTEFIESIYATAVDEAMSWRDLGSQLCELMGAQDATLGVPGCIGNVLTPRHPLDMLYEAHYRRIDPLLAAGKKLATGPDAAQGKPVVRMGHELVTDAVLLRSEFYTDYSCPRGRHHMIGSMLNVEGAGPITAHRDPRAGPFGEEHRYILATVTPHLNRALSLRQRLAVSDRQYGASALDALPVAVIVLDAGMRVRYLNHAADALVSHRESGLTIAHEGPPGNVRNLILNVRHREDHRRLAHVVEIACAGGDGAAMKLHARRDKAPTLATFVAPMSSPAGVLALSRSLALQHLRTAMLIIRDTAAVATPGVTSLIGLFGLTRSEAEVASILAGGVTAEAVALRRGVSLDTVRSQVRGILRKTNATSLRDFEHIVALTSGLQPASNGSGS